MLDVDVTCKAQSLSGKQTLLQTNQRIGLCHTCDSVGLFGSDLGLHEQDLLIDLVFLLASEGDLGSEETDLFAQLLIGQLHLLDLQRET